MATIKKIIQKDGTFTYRVMIRKKGIEISKTFICEEDAILYEKYKERLIINKKNFDINIRDRVTLEQIFELKINSFHANEKNRKTFEQANNKFKKYFKDNDFLTTKNLDDWLDIAKKMYAIKVFKGAKTEKGERFMAPKTLKRIFAYASSAISYAREQGIAIDNHPLTVINTYINLLKTPHTYESN